jgi:hypothetical protein
MLCSATLKRVIATVALYAATACGDAALVTAPGTDSGPLTLPPTFDTTPVQTLSRGMIVKRTDALSEDISVTQTITPDGGWISIPQAGLYMYFSRGAVSVPLEVTATAHKGNRVVYSFEPHGTRFAAPVYLAQLLRYTELNTPRNRKQQDPWYGYMPDGLADVNDDGSGSFAEIFNAEYYGKGNETYALGNTVHFSGYELAYGRRDTEAQ